MSSRRHRLPFVLCLWLMCGLPSLSSAQPLAPSFSFSDAQSRQLRDARAALGKTAVSYREGDYEDAKRQLDETLDVLERVLRSLPKSQREAGANEIQPLLRRVNTAHVMLQLQGVTVDPIRIGDGTDWLDGDATPATSPVVEVTDPPKRTANPAGEVSFSVDVAPLIATRCDGCHVGTRRVRGGLRMDSFDDLLKGGDSGDLIEPGESESSLLVKRLRGEEGDRMPGGGRPPLEESQIATIATWIDQGAKFDGQNTGAPLADLQREAFLRTATPEDISKRRADEAQQMIRLVSGEKPFQSAVVEPFLVVGPERTEVLQEIGQLAQEQARDIAGWLRMRDESAGGLFGGRATLFVLSRRYDYAEFTRMVEQRTVPDRWDAHARYVGLNAYLVLHRIAGEEATITQHNLVAPLVTLALETRAADFPDWLSRGLGEAIAYQRARRLDRSEQSDLRERYLAAAVSTNSAEAFLDQELPAEQAEALATGIATAMISGSRRRGFTGLLRFLNEADTFDAAFRQAFGVTLEAFVEAYLKNAR